MFAVVGVRAQGASGVGIGNFQEFGPLDANLNRNPYTWRKKAHLLFVVGPAPLNHGK